MEVNLSTKKIKELINNLLGRIYLRPIITALRSLKILENDYGHFMSSLKWSAIDKNGKPIPWFSYPAIEYLKQLNLRSKTLFEYGSGNSTLFWSPRCKKVISVESDERWFRKVLKNLKRNKNTKLILIKNKEDYINEINKYKYKFDIIAVDGKHRKACAKEAVKKLKNGGAIILDNSDWFPDTARYLRRNNLIQVDFSGFGPINPYVSVTSLFLHRDFKFKPADKQPKHVIGGLNHLGDEDN